MVTTVTINNITGQTPYYVYVCQSDGTGCFFIDTVSTLPFSFDIPVPNDIQLTYMIKAIDANKCVITGVTSVT